jgi:hypothetical protein
MIQTTIIKMYRFLFYLYDWILSINESEIVKSHGFYESRERREINNNKGTIIDQTVVSK